MWLGELRGNRLPRRQPLRRPGRGTRGRQHGADHPRRPAASHPPDPSRQTEGVRSPRQSRRPATKELSGCRIGLPEPFRGTGTETSQMWTTQAHHLTSHHRERRSGDTSRMGRPTPRPRRSPHRAQAAVQSGISGSPGTPSTGIRTSPVPSGLITLRNGANTMYSPSGDHAEN